MGINDPDASTFENVLHDEVLQKLRLAGAGGTYDIKMGVTIGIGNLRHLVLIFVFGIVPTKIEGARYLLVVQSSIRWNDLHLFYRTTLAKERAPKTHQKLRDA